MPNLDLTGVVPVQINHAYTITLTAFSLSVDTPTHKKFGAFGVIGKAKGPKDVKGSFKLAVPKTGLEVDLDSISNFTITYSLGLNSYIITGCDITAKNLSVEEQGGATEISASFDAAEEVPV